MENQLSYERVPTTWSRNIVFQYCTIANTRRIRNLGQIKSTRINVPASLFYAIGNPLSRATRIRDQNKFRVLDKFVPKSDCLIRNC